MNEGVSVIICCYNSSWVIERTLNSLLHQKNLEFIKYEIIVVDNCSNDNTNKIVDIFFKSHPKIQTKLIYEATPGLIFARKSGIASSQYSYLLFCDDDNILCDNYIETVFRVLNGKENIAACGGFGIPEFLDCSKPKWFDEYAKAYAIGKLDRNQGYLYGAGCCFRRAALLKLSSLGYKPLLTGRKKNRLLAGDDSEMTKALVGIGYELCPLDNISFSHVLTNKRLTEKYLISMHYGFGKAALVLDVYDLVMKNKCFNISIFSYFLARDLVRTLVWGILRLNRNLRSQVIFKFYLGKFSSYFCFDYFTLKRQYRLFQK